MSRGVMGELFLRCRLTWDLKQTGKKLFGPKNDAVYREDELDKIPWTKWKDVEFCYVATISISSSVDVKLDGNGYSLSLFLYWYAD